LRSEFERLSWRLEEQSMTIALRHLEQAAEAYERREWESSNAQLRSFLEAVFDQVARIRLGCTRTGGAARQELQAEGLLSSDEGRLVQSFMAVAGGRGSHAGSSSQDEASGRWLIATGIALLGLALVPVLIRVEDVLVGNVTTSAGNRLPTDAEVRTSCPTCRAEQTLVQARIRRDGEETVYHCRNGCQPIVVVGLPGESAWPGRGYRLGDNVIRNAADLHVPIVGTGKEVLIPASQAALMRQRPNVGVDEQSETTSG